MAQMFLHFFFFITVTFGLEHDPGVRRVYVKVGDDALLPCSPNPHINLEPHVFDWRIYGSQTVEVFMYDAGVHHNNGRPGQSDKFKGRVSHFKDQLKHGNASIKITDVRPTDGGIYTCFFPNLQPRQEYKVELIVGANPVTSILEETQDWSLLKCEVRGVSPEPKLEWQDRAGNVLPADEPQVTKIGGNFDKTIQMTVDQTDRYRCVLTQEDIGHRSSADVQVVIDGPSKPYVTILDQTHDWPKLQCEVLGAFPKPTLEWQDRAGNVLHAEEPKVTERRGRFDIISQIVVKKTDLYRCVVTQEKILHQTASEIFVRVNEGPSAEEVIGLLFGGMVIASLILAAVLFMLRAKKFITLSLNKAPGQDHDYDPEPIADCRPTEYGCDVYHSEMKDLCGPTVCVYDVYHSEMKDLCRPTEYGCDVYHSEMKDLCRPTEYGCDVYHAEMKDRRPSKNGNGLV